MVVIPRHVNPDPIQSVFLGFDWCMRPGKWYYYYLADVSFILLVVGTLLYYEAGRGELAISMQNAQSAYSANAKNSICHVSQSEG